jgi:hypothetical protein
MGEVGGRVAMLKDKEQMLRLRGRTLLRSKHSSSLSTSFSLEPNRLQRATSTGTCARSVLNLAKDDGNRCVAARYEASPSVVIVSGWRPLFFQQHAEHLQHRVLVPAFLQQNVEHLALVVDRTPQPHTFSTELHHHLVRMPAPGRRMTSAPQVGRENLAELSRPAADRRVANLDPALARSSSTSRRLSVKQKYSQTS